MRIASIGRIGWIVAMGAIAGCMFVGGDRRREAAPKPAPVAAEPVKAEPKGPPTYACPAGDLHIELAAARKIDTRRASSMTVAEHKRIKWPAEHWKPPGAGFVRAADDAIAALVALEAKNPALMADAFRADLLARPRDPALRLHAAACEVQQVATRRRGSYDAAMALLLGAPADEASRLLALGTKSDSRVDPTAARFGITNASRTDFCGAGKPPCGDGSYCDLARGECVTREQHVHAYISAVELDIEDTLTRALFQREIAGQGIELPDDARAAWMADSVHRCHAQVCKLTMYDQPDGKAALVEFDRRDAGTVEEIPMTPAERRNQAACMKSLGFPSRDACKYDCWTRFDAWGPSGARIRDACERACVSSSCF